MAYIFLEKRIIYFFLLVNFDLSKVYTEKYIYLKCNGKIEGGFHQKGKIYQQDLFPWCTLGRLFKLLDIIARKLHNTCNS